MRDEQVLSHLLRADPDLIHAAAEVAGKRTARQIVSERFKVSEAVPEPVVGAPPAAVSSPPLPAPRPQGVGCPHQEVWGVVFELDIQRGRDANCEGSLSRDNFLF